MSRRVTKEPREYLAQWRRDNPDRVSEYRERYKMDPERRERNRDYQREYKRKVRAAMKAEYEARRSRS